MPTRTLRLAIGGLVAAGALAVPAVAAAPTAVTGTPTDIAATTATVTATVSPNGESTTYWFEYGTTTAYGGKTASGGPIKGNGDRSVSASLTGLSPSTTYHYRVVAANASGTVTGADATFTTTAPGASPTPALTATASRRTVTFGGRTTISGVLAGPGNAGQSVTLEEKPAPFTGPFRTTGLTTTTDAAGNYSFTVAPARSTIYRTVVKTKKPTTSPEVAVRVRVRVTLGVSDRTPAAGQRVRLAGSVLPGHTGRTARLQRRTARGAWRTIAKRTLIRATSVNGVTRSRYAFRIRVRRTGTYRVRVAPADGDHIAGNSRRRKLTVG